MLNNKSAGVPSKTWDEFQHMFLIRLAPVWLACRWRVMGHPLQGKNWPKPDLGFDLLGMVNYAEEMRLTCIEERERHLTSGGSTPLRTDS